MMVRRAFLVFAVAIAVCACSKPDKETPPAPSAPSAPPAAPRSITVATTTSTRDSGLLDVLLPRFREKSGVEVKIVAVGSGQALEIGRRGDADALLVHSPDAEEKFMAEGHGSSRRPVMFNDFVILGPKEDPAHIAAIKTAPAALSAIASAKAKFVSRGDSSGTHVKEQQIWKSADVTPKGDWYKSVGQGMGEVLRMANEMGAYTISDRATYLAQKKSLALAVLVQKDPALVNPYSVIAIDPKKHATVHADEATKFVDFLLAPETQKQIAEYDIARDGEASFFVYPPK